MTKKHFLCKKLIVSSHLQAVTFMRRIIIRTEFILCCFFAS
jgi:hypothetical protein